MRTIRLQVGRLLALSLALGLPALAAVAQGTAAQPVAQSPSPMVDHTRPHPRIPQSEAMGRRVELNALKGARLFLGSRVNPSRPVPLLIHFHGASWLFELHIARS